MEVLIGQNLTEFQEVKHAVQQNMVTRYNKPKTGAILWQERLKHLEITLGY